jgi:hypothetical protein
MVCGIFGNGLREEINSLVVVFGREGLVSEIFESVCLYPYQFAGYLGARIQRTSDIDEFR